MNQSKPLQVGDRVGTKDGRTWTVVQGGERAVFLETEAGVEPYETQWFSVENVERKRARKSQAGDQ